MRYLTKNERDLGVCAALICPHCQSLSRFMLREVSAALAFFGLPVFAVDRCYQLFCGSCGFRKDVDHGELGSAMAAMRLFAQLDGGEISPAEYLEELGRLEFPALHELREEAMVWTCPRCTEKVPEKLGACWQCHSVRQDTEGTIATDEFRPPELPSAITRPSNPWEGF
jgi:hypothetical protein